MKASNVFTIVTTLLLKHRLFLNPLVLTAQIIGRISGTRIAGIASQTILPKIFNISRITRFDVYGDPSEELQKVLTTLMHSFTIYLPDSVVKLFRRLQR